jgi:hypothetical protein
MLRSQVHARCARCGLPVEHGASASPYYGSVGMGPVVTARMTGNACCCVQPDLLSADVTERTTR